MNGPLVAVAAICALINASALVLHLNRLEARRAGWRRSPFMIIITGTGATSRLAYIITELGSLK